MIFKVWNERHIFLSSRSEKTLITVIKERNLVGELGVPVEEAGTDPNLCPGVDCGGYEGEISELIRNHVQLFNSEDNYYWDQYKLLK